VTATQGDKEFDAYLTELKTLALYCKFGELEDKMIVLRIVLGINEDTFRERLLREPELSLEKSKFLRATEQSKKHLQVIRTETEKEGASLEAIQQNRPPKKEESKF